MSLWACGIGACEYAAEQAEDLIRHQSLEHPARYCKVCDAEVPDGFVAIHHVIEKHTRAEYVRAYDATADDIRRRETVKTVVEGEVDVRALLRELDVAVGDGEHPTD